MISYAPETDKLNVELLKVMVGAEAFLTLEGGRKPVVLMLQRWLGQNACDEIKARLFILYHSRRHIDDVGVRQRLLARQQPPTHSKGYEEKQ